MMIPIEIAYIQPFEPGQHRQLAKETLFIPARELKPETLSLVLTLRVRASKERLGQVVKTPDDRYFLYHPKPHDDGRLWTRLLLSMNGKVALPSSLIFLKRQDFEKVQEIFSGELQGGTDIKTHKAYTRDNAINETRQLAENLCFIGSHILQPVSRPQIEASPKNGQSNWSVGPIFFAGYVSRSGVLFDYTELDQAIALAAEKNVGDPEFKPSVLELSSDPNIPCDLMPSSQVCPTPQAQ